MDADERTSFDLNTALRYYLDDPASVPCPDADTELLDADLDSLTPAQINAVLDPIIDAIAEDADAIAKCAVLDTLQFLLKCAHSSHSTRRGFADRPRVGTLLQFPRSRPERSSTSSSPAW